LFIPCLLCVFTALPSGAAEAAFDARTAERRARAFERSYFSNYDSGVSRFYGRLWAKIYARKVKQGSASTVWQQFVDELAAQGTRPMRLDCTLYAQEILRAGMRAEEYERLRREHNALWPGRGFAGWSVGYLLTTKFGWKAYAIINRSSTYYGYYLHHFRTKKQYPVWKQPNIDIEAHFILGKDDRAIERLLQAHRFGWGFSDGGIHTWITFQTNLKECHWDCGPSRRYEIPNTHDYYRTSDLKHHTLFKTTRFIRFSDYHAHLVVFPPDADRRSGHRR
jgi:hypothetical protein